MKSWTDSETQSITDIMEKEAWASLLSWQSGNILQILSFTQRVVNYLWGHGHPGASVTCKSRSETMYEFYVMQPDRDGCLVTTIYVEPKSALEIAE